MDKIKSNYEKTHHYSDVKSIPQIAHYAVLVNEQRADHDYYSKDNSPHMSTYIQYVAFDDIEAVEAWILDPQHANKTYRVILVTSMEVQKHASVTIKE